MLSTLLLLWASYRQYYLRTLIVILAILIAGAGFSSVLILNESAKQSYQKAAQPLLQNVFARITSQTELTKQDYADLRIKGFNNVVPVLRKRIKIKQSQSDNFIVANVIGMDMFALLSLPPLNDNVSTRESFENENTGTVGFNSIGQSEVIIHKDYAIELGLQDQQILTLDNQQRLPKLKVTQHAGLGRQIVLDIGILQSSTEQTGLTEIFVVGKLDSALVKRLENALPEHLHFDKLVAGEDASALTGSFHLNLQAMSLLMFVVCMFVVMNALNLLTLKRISHFKLLRQLGVSRSTLYQAMLIEMGILCLLTTPLSVLLGISLAEVLSPAVTQTISSLYNVHIGFYQLSFVSLLIKSFSVVLTGAMCALALPIWLLNTRLCATQYTKANSRLTASWLIGAVICSILATILVIAEHSLLSSFSAIALLVFAGCFTMIDALPRLLRVTEGLVPRHFVMLKWSLADSVKATGLSKIAYCAFFIAVACNIGMNLMVDSFRQATEDWLAQRLHAQGYLYTNHPEELVEYTRTLNLQAQLIPRKSIDAKIKDIDLTILSYPTGKQFQQAMVFVNAIPEVWSEFDSQNGILINQQLALAHGYRLNDYVELSINQDTLLKKQIVGIYYDYGNPGFQTLLSLAQMNQFSATSRMFAVFSNSEREYQNFSAQLLESNFDYTLYDTDQLMQVSMQTFDRTFVITKSLNWITLFVAAFSLASSIVIIDMDSRAQRGLVRSMGVSRSKLFQLGVFQYLTTSLLVCLVATPFGIALSWLLINLVNAQAFYWTYPLKIFTSSILGVGAASLIIVALVSAFPLLAINKRKIIEDIKWLE